MCNRGPSGKRVATRLDEKVDSYVKPAFFQFVCNKVICNHVHSLDELTRGIRGCVQQTNTEDFHGLSISESNVDYLHPELFAGLENLQKFEIFESRLTRLPGRLFQKVKCSIKDVTLAGCIITDTLDGTIFDGLANLTNLIICFTNCDQLPSFEDLVDLQMALLYDNNLRVLHPDTFVNNTKITCLKLGINLLEDLPNGLFDTLVCLKELYLDENNLADLPDGLFDKNIALETLDLKANCFSKIPAALKNLKKLSRLFLCLNKIEEIGCDNLEGLVSLHEFGVSYNRIGKLEGLAFRNAPNIKTLNFYHNGMSWIDPLAFKGLKRLESVCLSENKFRKLPVELFQDCGKLQELKCDNCEIEAIEDCLGGLNEINTLSLMDNTISNIKTGTLRGTKINRLCLGKNQLEQVNETAFSGLEQLEELELQDNQLERLPHRLFDNLTHLIRLNLTKNVIAELPMGLFEHLRNLKTLNLGNNRLQGLDDGIFKGLEKLEVLDLSYNQISCIQPGALEGLVNLTKFDASSNKISGVPTGFNSNLSKLDLSNNQIEGVEAAAFEGLRIHWLSLKGNGICRIDRDAFSSLNNLITLELQGNELLEIPSHGDLTALKQLDLSDNSIESLCEGSLDDLVGLCELQLTGNKIVQVSKTVFRRLRSLQTLRLGKNEIGLLHNDTFKGLSDLRTLDLSSNKLVKVDGLFEGLALTFLKLTGNPLTNLPDDDISGCVIHH